MPAALRDEDYYRAFDAHTLIYDCVYSEDRREYLFTGPEFRNLWPILRDGLRIDGKPVVRLRRQTVGRCDLVRVKGGIGKVSVQTNAGELIVSVRRADKFSFSGHNVLMAISRNNPLQWIREWAQFHAEIHQADAVLLFDNGSSDYSLQEISDCLRDIKGISSATVVSAPFIFGAKLTYQDTTYRLENLHLSMFNLARCDIANRARAILSCDIDELVQPLRGGSIFDAASHAVTGGVQIPGHWVYPERTTPVPCPQHMNRFRSDPDRTCQPKWCARPNGPLSRWGGWNVHSFGGGLRKLVPLSKEFRLAHCSGTTTAWKPRSRRFDFPETLVEDEELAAAMDRSSIGLARV